MKNKKNYKTNLNGIFKGALCNLQRNLHLFLENIEPRTENKNLSLGKTVLKMWSLIGEKMT